MSRTRKTVEEGGLAARLPGEPASSGWAVGIASAAGVMAAWTAAGSLGQMAHSFRHVATLLFLGLAWVAITPRFPEHGQVRRFTSFGVALAALVIAGSIPNWTVVNLLAVVVGLAGLANAAGGPVARMLGGVTAATALFTLYRAAYLMIPAVWQAANMAGAAIGWTAGKVLGRQLQLGATFGGIDFLVLGVALVLLAGGGRRRLSGLLAMVLLLLAIHAAYLASVAYAGDLAAWLPPAPEPPPSDLEQTPFWSWSDALRALLPWNLPGLVGLFYAVALGGWAARGAVSPFPGSQSASGLAEHPAMGWARAGDVAAIALALGAPLAGLAALPQTELAGKTILAYGQGFLDWERPQHDSYGDSSAGAYGMLPVLVERLGGKFLISSELSQKELSQADLLLVIHPNQPWEPSLHKRIWDYVEGGGRLLVAADQHVEDGAVKSSFNELLEPTRIRVRRDQAVPLTVRWRQALDLPLYPAVLGLDDAHDRIIVEGGTSIATTLPATPILVGQYGLATEARADGASANSWQRLGDLGLAAQQRYGQGQVVVLGHSSSLTNLSLPASYTMVARLLAGLAGRQGDGHQPWRQALTALGLALLAGVVIRIGRPQRAQMAGVALAMVWTGAVLLADWHGRATPRGDAAMPVAYVDATHLESHSGSDWSPRGINGFVLNLMRNGYLPLLAPDLSPGRLAGASLLVCTSPAKPYSADQRRAMTQFVQDGGTLICTVGADQSDGSRELLADFGFRVPVCPEDISRQDIENVPMGCCKTQYAKGSKAEVVFYAGWEVHSEAKNAVVRVTGQWGRPILLTRPMGRGVVAVIGDSYFALNDNLEQVDGATTEAAQRNPIFWRWLLTVLAGRSEWTPPDPPTAEAQAKPSKPSPDQPEAKQAPSQPREEKPRRKEASPPAPVPAAPMADRPSGGGAAGKSKVKKPPAEPPAAPPPDELRAKPKTPAGAPRDPTRPPRRLSREKEAGR